MVKSMQHQAYPRHSEQKLNAGASIFVERARKESGKSTRLKACMHISLYLYTYTHTHIYIKCILNRNTVYSKPKFLKSKEHKS